MPAAAISTVHCKKSLRGSPNFNFHYGQDVTTLTPGYPMSVVPRKSTTAVSTSVRPFRSLAVAVRAYGLMTVDDDQIRQRLQTPGKTVFASVGPIELSDLIVRNTGYRFSLHAAALDCTTARANALVGFSRYLQAVIRYQAT
jgi:hypothetical protein